MIEQCAVEVAKMLTLSVWQKILAFALVLFVERWLGRTKKVEANSIIDLVQNAVTGKTAKEREDVRGPRT
jgi:hypothetical protein